ncbi:hypothetical protein [Carnobacterium sp. TMP28]|uniref:hypothetical protein n=1 Tax=Carnobacterium sp. TMP28 TaxID=3397060 RepID=UPI0039E074D4
MKILLKITLTLIVIGAIVKEINKSKSTTPTKKEQLQLLNDRLINQVNVLQENTHIMQEWFVKEIEKNAVEKYQLLIKKI